MTKQEKILYFDTNAIRALGFATEFAALAEACKEGNLKACVSQVVIWERGRQKYEADINENRNFPSVLLSETAKKDYFKAKITAYQRLYEIYKIDIIPYINDDDGEIKELIASPDTYFSSSKNDRRDAIILHSAIKNFSPDEILIVCEETNLATEFKKRDYEVHKKAKLLIQELLGEAQTTRLDLPDINTILSDNTPIIVNQDFIDDLENLDPDYVEMFSEDSNCAELDKFINDLADIDSEIKRKILGYTNWYDPIAKEKLKSLLIKQNYSSDQISINAERLCSVNILKDIGNFYLPNKLNSDAKNIYRQATLEMMDEIINSLGLNL